MQASDIDTCCMGFWTAGGSQRQINATMLLQITEGPKKTASQNLTQILEMLLIF